jgi:hypothetical protein
MEFYPEAAIKNAIKRVNAAMTCLDAIDDPVLSQPFRFMMVKITTNDCILAAYEVLAQFEGGDQILYRVIIPGNGEPHARAIG